MQPPSGGFLFGGESLNVIVPFAPSTNQTTSVTLPVNNGNITLKFTFTYNTPGGYWFMSVTQNGTLLLDAVPLVTGEYPAGNILSQYDYMQIGSAYIVPVTSVTTNDPTFDTMGTDFYLVWSDNQAS